MPEETQAYLPALSFRALTPLYGPVLRVVSSLVADFGRPQNLLMRIAFLGLQLFDGFGTTAENVAGLLPLIFGAAGFPGGAGA